MAGRYFSDEAHLRTWLTVEKDLDGFKKFLDEYVFGVRDFDEYLLKCGGLARMRELRGVELLL